MRRFSLLLALALGLAACAGGSQGDENRTEPDCRQWGEWQDVGGIPSFQYRLRYCGYDEASQEQIWQAQFSNEHWNGMSFTYGLGEDPRRYRMDLSASRTRSSIHLRVRAAEESRLMWIHFEQYCTWAVGMRSC